jgi:HSP20 family protein
MAKKTNNVPNIYRGGFFETFEQLQNKIRARAYDIFQSREHHEGNEISDWLAAESDVLTGIALDFHEEDDQYIVSGEIPNFAPDEIDIHVDDHTLSVGGSHRVESKKKTKDGETSSSSEINFFRRMSLPDDADSEHLDAVVKDGKLRVTLPKI